MKGVFLSKLDNDVNFNVDFNPYNVMKCITDLKLGIRRLVMMVLWQSI